MSASISTQNMKPAARKMHSVVVIPGLSHLLLLSPPSFPAFVKGMRLTYEILRLFLLVSHGAIWNNPPYSNIRPWVEKAAEQCIQQRQTVVMLVPEDMSVGWFSKALESVDEVRIITDGRINFIEPSTGLEKKGNSKGSMLLIWRPFISPRRMFTTVSKAALMAIGQGVRRAA
ncbi:phage N-6-adenine-methyltransferase [Escherichia coli]|nr:phage N-6-adenine-methyltransferase [Escherichia coli]EFL6451686.1 phage N-6-adenine-methyltransferase [Escherichia coli]EFM4219067.1 phage N-6-adenine-methyltransferase [Escherichia coli]EFN9797995.1 phage N-6-adenine-methyltransferase [Escherichia coli]EFP2221136.1 phage N-6-adenine-methyltransferase [Escherichia coli]